MDGYSETVTVPIMPELVCGIQTYVYVPGVSNVCEYDFPFGTIR